ncbi:hypothetical protein CR513_11373, partial [Mucuna pruriens]
MKKEEKPSVVTKNCNVVLPRIFTFPSNTWNKVVNKDLCHLGANVNLMDLYLLENLGEEDIKSTKMNLQLPNKSIKHPYFIK